MKKIPRKFYTRNTLLISKELLGKYIVRKIGNRKLVGKIVETEAYIGPQDKASHAYKGKITKRNKVEYLKGGYVYIYLVYGMYWQFNITTSTLGKPECILIRALEPVGEKEKSERIASGPGKLCRWMKFDKSFYGEDLVNSKRIWLAATNPLGRASFKRREDGDKIKNSQIVATKRIGIDYAKEWAEKPWRFYIKGNPFVSGKKLS